jgi:predicted RNase H-like HicB family nuclease
MKQSFSASIWQEGELFVAQCLQINIASQGPSEKEALDNLKEALELHFESPTPTDVLDVRTVEVEICAT